ncbi:diguanylate cyclase, partial [Paraburkholderia sp. SIMBA_054]
VALGANVFAACLQIAGQREADARMLHSTHVRQSLDAYQSALDGGLAALGRLEAAGDPPPVDAAATMNATLASLESKLQGELADEPAMLATLAQVGADRRRLQSDIGDAPLTRDADEPAASRAWTAASYMHAGLGLQRVEAGLAALRAAESRALQASLAASSKERR